MCIIKRGGEKFTVRVGGLYPKKTLDIDTFGGLFPGEKKPPEEAII